MSFRSISYDAFENMTLHLSILLKKWILSLCLSVCVAMGLKTLRGMELKFGREVGIHHPRFTVRFSK